MKKLFKSLVSILIILSMIFTMGIDLIEQDKVAAEKEAPLEATVEKLAEKPVEEAEEKPAEKPVEEPLPKPEEKPVEAPVTQPEEKPVENPVEEPVTEPEDKPVGEPVEELEEKPAVEEIEEVKEEKIEEEVEEVVLDPLKITLTDAETSIEDPIELGIENDPSKQNYMEVKGGDGDYSYQWRILGEDTILYDDENPRIDPEELNPEALDLEGKIKYELTVRDLSGNEERSSMTLVVTKPKGSIRVAASALDLSNEIFDIFIKGPGGSLYTVSLASGESKTIKNLRRGRYTVVPIVPMNYKSTEIENVSIRITKENYEKNTKVNYERTNNSWFYSR